MEKRSEDLECVNWYHNFNKIKDALPEESPICAEHDETVSVRAESYVNPESPAPNIIVVFNYCCEDALKKEINFRNEMLAQNKHHGDA